MPKFYWTVRCTPTPLAPPVYCFETSGSYTSFSFTTPIGKVMNVSGIRVCSQVTRIRIQIRHHTDTNHPTYILTRHIWQETVILQYKPTIGTLSYNWCSGTMILVVSCWGGESSLRKGWGWEEVAVVVRRQSSWLGLGPLLSNHIKEKESKMKKAYLPVGAHQHRYVAGLAAAIRLDWD